MKTPTTTTLSNPMMDASSRVELKSTMALTPEIPKSVTMTAAEKLWSLSLFLEKEFCKLGKKVKKAIVRSTKDITSIIDQRMPSKAPKAIQTIQKHPRKRKRSTQLKTKRKTLNRTRQIQSRLELTR